MRGDYVIYQNDLYKCLQDTSGVWDATKWEQAVIGDDLEQKANIDGLYEEMTVGGAEQLISDTFNIESVPYNFRTSGGSLDIGDRETDKLIGGTVAWNQLVYSCKQNQSTVTQDGTRYVVTSNGTQVYFGATIYKSNSAVQDVVIGHRYYATVNVEDISVDAFSQIYFTGMQILGGSITAVGNAERLMTATDIRTAINARTANALTTTNDSFTISNIMLIDLTAMFGTTIADYIYTLETQTAGAGVAFFKKLFPAPYYAYNAGQLMSVNAGSHVMNGFNQWDEEWESYGSSGQIRSKNAIRVISGATYYAKSPNGLSLYFKETANGATVSTASVGNGTFTVPDGCNYMMLYTGTGYGTTYNNDICINLSWDGERNGEYEPYVSHTYELDDTLELRGIPKLDANNQLYYDGDVYESDGSVTRKYGIVDLGTLAWSQYTYNYQNCYLSETISDAGIAGSDIVPNIFCPKYVTVKASANAMALVSRGDNVITTNTTNKIFIWDTNNYATATAFKTAMSGVYLVYELATPTTESATPYTNPQIVNDWGTETYTDYSYDAQTRDVKIPVGHETRYMANLKAKLEMAPDSPSGDGDYIVRQADGTNSYVPLVIPNELPTMPTTDGNWVLRCTVSSGTATLSWVSAT